MTGFRLSVKKISKNFGDVVAVENASFEISGDSCTLIKGTSGSGKTTLLRLVAGLELPDAGEIYINGEIMSSPLRAHAPHLRKTGFVFQSPTLWPHLSVAGNILFGIAGWKKEARKKRLEELLTRIDLAGYEKRYPDQLSGGEARRVALARTLAPGPVCLLMDEPLSNLDDRLKADMLKLIKSETTLLNAALIYVTHDSAEAAELGGRIMTMQSGRLTEETW